MNTVTTCRKSNIGSGRRFSDNRAMSNYIAFILFAGLALAGDLTLGKAPAEGTALSVAQVLASESEYIGKVIQVRGRITEVCQAMGCWMNLTDNEGRLLRVQVEDEGSIKFPQSSIGKEAVAEGTLKRDELTRDQVIASAKHEALENGKPFHPEIIKSGKTIYTLAGTGAIIFSK